LRGDIAGAAIDKFLWCFEHYRESYPVTSTTIVAELVIRFFPCVFYELHPVEAFAHSVRNHVRPWGAVMETTLRVAAMMKD
jgi:hypothetical protein